MAKRGDRVAPPPRADEWELIFGTIDAANGWEELARQAPGPTRDAYDALSRDPRDTWRLGRQHRLHGALATVRVGGGELEQWQYEVTAAGRVWYGVDVKRQRVVLTYASTNHPKVTE